MQPLALVSSTGSLFDGRLNVYLQTAAAVVGQPMGWAAQRRSDA